MPIYHFTCPVCNWSGDRITKLADRDTQVCGRDVQIAGIDPAFEIRPDGKVTMTEVSIVPLGTQRDKRAVLRYPCEGQLTREEIGLNAKMGHFWQV